MSMVMFVIGCIAVMVGVGMVGFGIPVNEFSFGNTLIVSGTTLATGGIIVVALSVVVNHLHRIADTLATGRAPIQPTRPVEAPEAQAEQRTAAAHVPFPPKTGMKAGLRELRPAALPVAQPLPPVATDLDADERSLPPSLRNPEASVTVEDDVSLSPQYQHGDAGEPARQSTSYFDSMWPAKPRTSPVAEPQPAPKPEIPMRAREPIARTPQSPSAPRSAAVLKSGVVDGMAYTLYVDGSIEAELPQGILRFASIDELRSHLEKNS